MAFAEFIEAIGRIADKLNIPHLLEVIFIYNYIYIRKEINNKKV
jgi:hypothetical protein